MPFDRLTLFELTPSKAMSLSNGRVGFRPPSSLSLYEVTVEIPYTIRGIRAGFVPGILQREPLDETLTVPTIFSMLS